MESLNYDLLSRMGRPRAQWSAADLASAAHGLGIRLVSLLHVGGDGLLKTLDFAPRNEAHLRRILAGGERADGSSLFSGLTSGASDIVLRPRPETSFLDPFAPVPTLCVLCGHQGADGQPLAESPDTIVRRAFELVAEETGVRLEALGEIEFFLGRAATDADVHCRSDGGYHACAPFVHGERLRRRALLAMAEIGIPVKYGHAEVGYIDAAEPGGPIWEQHEIELDLLPLPAAADAIVLAQWIIRTAARREGLRCSMDPVVGMNHAGNGLHIHFAFGEGSGYRPVLEPDGQMGTPARWLTEGLTHTAGALMAFGNRTEGSFARLRQGKESPTRVGWGVRDRGALVRVPLLAAAGSVDAPAPTIEFRLPDGSAHPHLLLAAAAQALRHGRASAGGGGLRGARAGAPEGPAGVTLPRTHAEVAEALARHRAVLERTSVFPAALIDAHLRHLAAAAPGAP